MKVSQKRRHVEHRGESYKKISDLYNLTLRHYVIVDMGPPTYSTDYIDDPFIAYILSMIEECSEPEWGWSEAGLGMI